MFSAKSSTPSLWWNWQKRLLWHTSDVWLMVENPYSPFSLFLSRLCYFYPHKIAVIWIDVIATKESSRSLQRRKKKSVITGIGLWCHCCSLCWSLCLTYSGSTSCREPFLSLLSQQQQNIKCSCESLRWTFCGMLHLLSQTSLLLSYSAPARIRGIFGFSCGKQVLVLQVSSSRLLLMVEVGLVKSWVQQLRRSLISASFQVSRKRKKKNFYF